MTLVVLVDGLCQVALFKYKKNILFNIFLKMAQYFFLVVSCPHRRVLTTTYGILRNTKFVTFSIPKISQHLFPGKNAGVWQCQFCQNLTSDLSRVNVKNCARFFLIHVHLLINKSYTQIFYLWKWPPTHTQPPYETRKLDLWLQFYSI